MASLRITDVRVVDLRFPTSREQVGSDAVNKDPDYSAAYCILHTDSGLEGHGLTFTLGRGTELCVAALQSLTRFVEGRTLDSITSDLNGFYREVTADTQFRWLGPEKGVIHLACAALLNAVWDLYAKAEGKPVWKLLADMTPEQIVACIDFRYLADALTPDEALAILRRGKQGQAERLAHLQANGFPAYTTSAGWFGFSDEKIRALCHAGIAEGWTHFKLKVGGEPADDLRRGHIMRETIGPDCRMMVDANQKWGVLEAIERTRQLAVLEPWWMEEPTSPDDILGHARIRREAAPTRIATGEHCHNSVMFKQLFQAQAIDVCQIDSCRVAGINENLAILLMAAKFGVPVCPHAGGVGLCEYVQHLSIFDFLGVSCSLQDRVIEYVDHLHEHFVDPVTMRRGHYLLPTRPGYSGEIVPETLVRYQFPQGRGLEGVFMKFLSFDHQGQRRGGVLDGNILHVLAPTGGGDDVLAHLRSGAAEPKLSGESVALADVRLRSPLAHPPRIFGIGLNYREHAAESKMQVQAVPTVFLKLASSLCGSGDDVLLPPDAVNPDYEAELAVVIGKGGHRIAAADWEQHVFGYTILNDVSARGVQLATTQWTLGKSFPTFTPLGPALVTRDEIADPHALDIRLTLAGEVMQNANTRDLLFRIPELIAYLSSIVALEPGDIISTGTPPGVGLGRAPQRWIQDGEEMVLDIAGLGTLRNRARATA